MSTAVGQEKPLISISVIGHVDSGKSTVTGRLATRFGKLDERAMEKLKKVAADNKKESFTLAYFTDKTEQERKRGVTISTTLVEMQTSKYRINFLDCPGHADYIKNATSGVKQADLSIVVVPADFEASCSNDGTLFTHMTLAAMLGSKNFIICINKLDEVAARNAVDVETSFDAAVAAVEAHLKKLMLDRNKVIFLPISALKGIGIFKDSESFPFFKGWLKPLAAGESADTPRMTIMSLEEAIDAQNPPVRALDRPLRIPVSSTARVPSCSTAIICGRVDYGVLNKGDMIRILPADIVSDVKTIQAHHSSIDSAPCGMNVGIAIGYKEKIPLQDRVAAGHVIGPANDTEFIVSPCYIATCISMKRAAGAGGADEKKGIKNGYTPVISCGTTNVACKIVKIISSKGRGDKTEQPHEGDRAVPKDARFTCILYPSKPCVFEEVTKFPTLSKFVCRDSNALVMVGNITKRIGVEEAIKEYGVSEDAFGGKGAAVAGVAKKAAAPKKK